MVLISFILIAPIIVWLAQVTGVYTTDLSGFDGNGLNNWAVIVNTSPYWFNYRHLSNALIIYKTVRTLGIPDSRIIFMNSLEISNDVRNPERGKIFVTHDSNPATDVWNDVEVDMRGRDVSSRAFLDLLAGRSPLDRRHARPLLDSDENSNVLVYMTGHGGDEFLKFHDFDELTADNIAQAFMEMRIKKRYKEIIFMVDTCQAGTLGIHIEAPGVTTIASSVKGENSYGYYDNPAIGLTVVDRFTFKLSEYFGNTFTEFGLINVSHSGDVRRQRQKALQVSVGEFYQYFKPEFLRARSTMYQSPGSRKPSEMRLVDFFGNLNYMCENYNDDSGELFERCGVKQPVSDAQFEYISEEDKLLLMGSPQQTQIEIN